MSAPDYQVTTQFAGPPALAIVATKEAAVAWLRDVKREPALADELARAHVGLVEEGPR